METRNRCPKESQLRRLLKATLPEREETALSVHLEWCTRCRKSLEHLATEGKRLVGQTEVVGVQAVESDQDLKAAVDKLKLAKGGLGEEPSASDAILSLLEPSQLPGSLGRLADYEILEPVGHGGMGVVFKGLDRSLKRPVAIKMLAPQLAATAAARKRFLREGQAAAAIRHEHVITIYAVEEAKGLPHLVMEFVPGVSLQERINRTGSLALQEILRIGRQIAAGLAAAHAQGLVHRDIKPSNILLENGVERVKITDFGLARAVDDRSLTRSGVVAGTPEYMAPEQVQGQAVDHRADLFALGCLLYTMCTGEPPFSGTSSMAVMRKIVEQAPRPIKDLNPSIPSWLVAVIEKLLAKAPDDRFQSAAEIEILLSRELTHLQNPSWPKGASTGGKLFLRRVSGSYRKRLALSMGAVLLGLGVLALTEVSGITEIRGYLASILREKALPPAEMLAGVWEGLAVDKPGEGTSRDSLTLALRLTDDGRLEGQAWGEFTDGKERSLQSVRVNGDCFEAEIPHRTGVTMRIRMQLKEEGLVGEGRPIFHEEDSCHIRLTRVGRRAVTLLGRS